MHRDWIEPAAREVTSMKIAVIGAGVVGLATAYLLASQGNEVVVLEAREAAGMGTSFGNGGQLSYSYVAPLAAPSVLNDIPKWILDPTSPLRFKPSFEIAQWKWIAAFLRACTSKQSALTTRELLKLSLVSRSWIHRLVTEHRIDFSRVTSGKLIVYKRQKSLRKAIAQVALQSELGSDQSVLGEEECYALEPGLRQSRERILGGVFTESEETADCHKLCSAIHNILTSVFGVEFRFNTEVISIVNGDRKVIALQTSRGFIKADAYVVAGGIEGVGLLRNVGIDMNIYPLRGYSLTLPFRAGQPAISASITDYDKRVVHAPMGGILRVAGMVDLVPLKTKPDGGRIEQLLSDASNLFPDLVDYQRSQPWVGNRAATPTGIPVVGRTRFSNLYTNMGHGGLGFTLAFGTAERLAEIIDSASRPALRGDAARIAA